VRAKKKDSYTYVLLFFWLSVADLFPIWPSQISGISPSISGDLADLGLLGGCKYALASGPKIVAKHTKIRLGVSISESRELKKSCTYDDGLNLSVLAFNLVDRLARETE
jgi:hypothetical protein